MSDVLYINNSFNDISLSKHFHNDYSISLVYSGKHQYSNEKEKFKIVPGIIQVVNPFEMHTTVSSTWSQVNVMLTIDLINSISSEILQKDVNHRILLNPYINDEYASYLFISMFETLDDKDKTLEESNDTLFYFLDYILRNHSCIKENKALEYVLDKKLFTSTIDFIDDNIKNINISLDALSLNAGLSKFHFLREFKKNYGLTPSKFVQIKKINRVKELLKSNMDLSDITYECGFNDQSYMIKVFKKYTGYTPSMIKNFK